MGQIVFLGTTSMRPTKERNHSGITLHYKEENILFDCGEGIQRQMRIAGIKPSKITRVCISHWHGDHCFGLPGLMSTMGADQFAKTLHIYGPNGTTKYIDFMLKSFASIGIIDFEVHEIKQSGIIYENDEIELIAQKLKHSQPCYGYSFRQKDRRRINVAKIKELGLSGPILGKLQNGQNIMHKGEKILFSDVTYPVKGKKISYIADTRPCQGAINLAQDADIMICESTFHSDEMSNAKQHFHMTSKETATLAEQNNAKKLILTHISTRYKSPSSLLEEAQQIHNDVIFAKDFMKVNF
jgi:ribonuclease Z